MDTKEFKAFAKDKVLPFVVGATETGEPMFEDLTRVKHLLVAGTTGSGKSVWLLQLILTFLLWVPSEQLDDVFNRSETSRISRVFIF